MFAEEGVDVGTVEEVARNDRQLYLVYGNGFNPSVVKGSVYLPWFNEYPAVVERPEGLACLSLR